MNRRALHLLALSITLSGCARLGVNVDVMNPTFARTSMLEASLRRDATDLVMKSNVRPADAAARLWGIYEGFRQSCLTTRIKLADSSKDPDAVVKNNILTLTRLRDGPDARQAVRAQQNSTVILLEQADHAALQQIQASPNVNLSLQNLDTPLDPAIRASLLQRRNAFEAEAKRVKTYMNDQGEWCSDAAILAIQDIDGRNSIALAKAQAERALNLTVQQSITGGGVLLVNLLEAYYVTKAGKDYWAPQYNQAFGKGFGGSTSIAIKMNSTADFSIKGFVFDGRSTADMVKKVGTQALSIIASASGAPISLSRPSGATGSGPSYFDTGKLVSETEANIVTAQAQDAAYDATMLRVANTILANWSKLSGGDPTARTIVKASFDAYKDSWKASTP